jgi:hypothetical protein
MKKTASSAESVNRWLGVGLLGLAGLSAFFLALDSSPAARPENRGREWTPLVRFVDATRSWGLDRFSQTFGAVAADIDNDGRDDLLVSNHSRPPSLFLNRGAFFADRSDLLPEQVVSDWHGLAAVDVDNDGDKDILCAGGGSDGVGPGAVNRLFRSLLTETGDLRFENASQAAGIAFQPWRTRAFLSLPSPDGFRVDFYMVGLPRDDCPNLYLSNRSDPGRIVLDVDPGLGLNRVLGSEGLDLFFDYDRDGDPDLILLRQFHPRFYERRPDGYQERDWILPDVGPVYHLAAGDLDNDGYPDLFLSAYPPFVESDNLSSDAHELHFVVRRQDADSSDRLQFNAPGDSIEIDFSQHTPANPVTRATDIYIGPKGHNPPSRHATVKASEAEGRPNQDRPGTYLWKDPGASLWHVEWRYGANPGPFKGRIMAPGLSGVTPSGFETLPPVPAEDAILLNRPGRGFQKLETLPLVHDTRTRAAAMVDLNNDGLLDVVGIRGSEQGRPNGRPFALVNLGQLRFHVLPVMDSPDDDLFQADQLVVGFFDGDGRPDAFFTNGNGLNPGDQGPYKLFLNKTDTDGGFVILHLRGTAANRDAIGAEVELYSAERTFLGYREVGSGFHRQQSTLAVHFGLGHLETPGLVAAIRWPGTSGWDFRRVEPNRVNEISQ